MALLDPAKLSLAEFVGLAMNIQLEPYQVRVLDFLDKIDKQQLHMGRVDPMYRHRRPITIMAVGTQAARMVQKDVYLIVVDDPLDEKLK